MHSKIMVVALFLALALLPDRLSKNLYAGEPKGSGGGYLEMLHSLDIEPAFIDDPVFTSIRKRYARKEQRTIDRIMKRSEHYLPMIVEQLRRRQMPAALAYLAMTESHFNPQALSPQNARGLWQFMDGTAHHYGLVMDAYIDERMDPYRSTLAALDYLERLHKMFGKWYLAMLAYNCGEGTLRQAIRHAGTDELSVLLDNKKHYLPKESRYYVRKTISYVLFTQKTWYTHYVSPESPADVMIRVSVGQGETLSYIEKQLGLARGELKKINAQFTYGFTPPYGENSINLPARYADLYHKRYRPGRQKEMFLVHKVKKGEYLGSIADRYGIKYAMIAAFNKKHSTVIHPDDELIIPVPRGSYRPYRVKAGDSLYAIAQLFNVDLMRLKKRNGLEGTLIRVGDKLVIPD